MPDGGEPLPQDTLNWLKTNFFNTELELGHCLRAPAEGPCECDLSLRCSKFLTTRPRASMHRACGPGPPVNSGSSKTPSSAAGSARSNGTASSPIGSEASSPISERALSPAMTTTAERLISAA
ncbi:hypothetical protein [Streptomyces prasinopilosus]|uniref:Uncharacterized protein n=1 Tax=Streptomyces prasinopilosus TaxID=67344 RepID=A0A1G6XUC4_9ACTN|nr:hypothetical protein [Streptomyces prasinopilosus]SDD81778.1 hypothetical protein SAMN05216505_11282 [Streptomyces prasinopilosus]